MALEKREQIWLCLIACALLGLCAWNAVIHSKYESLASMNNDQSETIKMMDKRYNERSKRSVSEEFYGGATFVRWGKSSCPKETEPVYNGYAAGSNYRWSGGLSDLVCLTNNTHYVDYTLIDWGSSWINPARMYFDSTSGGSRFDASSGIAKGDMIKCAACRSWKRRSMMMIPGTSMCPNKWHREYRGFLMSELFDAEGRTGPVCVDHSPDAGADGPVARIDSRRTFMTHVKLGCTASTCGQFIDKAELSCVVCTR